MAWTDRPANLDKPGHIPKGDELEATLDQIAALTAAGWTDISSTYVVGAVTTPPTKGSSTYNVRYRRSAGADLVHFEFRILIDATWAGAPGSGVYRFPAPFNASASAILCANGAGYVFDNGTANRACVVRFENAGNLNVYNDGGASALTHAGSGTAWATGDIISGSIAYEPA